MASRPRRRHRPNRALGMNRRAEVGAHALTHSGLTDHADRQIRRAGVRRWRIERRPRLILRDLGRTLQSLSCAVQMPRSVTADVHLNAQGFRRWRRRLRLGFHPVRVRQEQDRSQGQGRFSRNKTEAARLRHRTPEPVKTRTDDEFGASGDVSRPAADARSAATGEANEPTKKGENRRHGADQNRVSRSISRRSADNGAPAISSPDSQRALKAVCLPKA